VNLTARSGARIVAASVARVLAETNIRAVLTGGGCASIYTAGIYQSVDLDFVLQSAATQSKLDEALARAGFERRGNQYFHPRARFYVEFPAGPLAIGKDYRIKPVELKVGGSRLLTLSPTDSCRDRLAAFLHWRDQQNLKTAVQIAVRNKVDLDLIQSWCTREGSPGGFEEFAQNLETAKRRPRARNPKK
jgi:hypothetical protein